MKFIYNDIEGNWQIVVFVNNKCVLCKTKTRHNITSNFKTTDPACRTIEVETTKTLDKYFFFLFL